MKINSVLRNACMRLLGVVPLMAVGISAQAAIPLVQCQSTTFEGASVCAVDMTSYAQVGGAGPLQCPPGVTSNGAALLCEQSFAAAIKDAKLFFGTSNPKTGSYLITIPAGSFDFSSESTALPGLHGAIDVTGVAPAGAGCLNGMAPIDGTIALSGNPCLIISGASTGATTLTTATGIPAIFGKAVSHVMFENMTMVQSNLSTTQGVFVTQGTQSFNGLEYPTLTVEISPGFPTPLALHTISCASNGPTGCLNVAPSSINGRLYLRAFTNTVAPQLIMSTTGADSNGQIAWGYPGSSGVAAAVATPTQPDAEEFPNRWTITLSEPASGHAIPTYYSATTDGKPNLLCMKVDDAQAFWFDDTNSGGTDVIMNNMKWIGAARGSFRGVNGKLTGGGLGAQVYNSSIDRGPPIQGQAQCLSSQSGGLQFGQPTDPPIYGNLVYGLKSQGTGDDSVAVFNDVGGTRTPTGGYYPQTVIAQSAIGNSFARDILLMNNHQYSGLSGNSPVSVDSYTRGQVSDDGNCDPLVLGTDNCPVTYMSY